MFELSEFYQFLKRPHYQFIERKKTSVLFTTIKLYLFSILILGLINSFNIIILRAFLILPIDESLIVPVSLKEHLWIYFLLVCVFSTIMEEVIFRLSIIFDPVYIALSLSTTIALVVDKVSNGIFPIVSFVLVYILINKFATIYRLNFTSFWNKNFKYIFYFLSILFGLVHIGNYKFIETYQYFIVIILIFPQLAIGFILSFTRIYYKQGFLICIIFHSLMNLISASIYLLQYSPY